MAYGQTGSGKTFTMGTSGLDQYSGLILWLMHRLKWMGNDTKSSIFFIWWSGEKKIRIGHNYYMFIRRII